MTWTILAAVAAGLALVSWRAGPGPGLRRIRPPGASPQAIRWRADHRRILAASATAASGLVLTIGMGWWGLLVACGLGAGSWVVLGGLASGAVARRRARLLSQLPQACDLLAVCLESGLPLRRAVEVVAGSVDAPLAEVLGELAANVRLGVDEARAWRELGSSEPTLGQLAAEVARATDSGVGLSRTLRVLGLDARRAAAAAAEVRARKVGVGSVLPLMTCFLPAFLLLGVVPIIGGVVLDLLP